MANDMDYHFVKSGCFNTDIHTTHTHVTAKRISDAHWQDCFQRFLRLTLAKVVPKEPRSRKGLELAVTKLVITGS